MGFLGETKVDRLLISVKENLEVSICIAFNNVIIKDYMIRQHC